MLDGVSGENTHLVFFISVNGDSGRRVLDGVSGENTHLVFFISVNGDGEDGVGEDGVGEDGVDVRNVMDVILGVYPLIAFSSYNSASDSGQQ